MTLTLPKPSMKRTIPWKDREHLFTPSNITKFEFACCKHCIYKRTALHPKVRPLKNGPCIWIMRGGKMLDFTPIEDKEEDTIEREIADHSGEPSEF